MIMAMRISNFLKSVWSKFEPNPRLDLDILEYHADQVELEYQPLPWQMRATMYLTLFIVLTALVWSIIAKIDRIVATEGELVSATPTIVIQPLENSVIKSFEVNVGDIVKAGQPLVTFDPTFSKADESRLKAREMSVLLQLDRLTAEVHGTAFQPSLEYDPLEATVQVNLFNGRNNEYLQKINSFDLQVAELSSMVKSLEEQHVESLSQLKILERIEDIHHGLYVKQSGSLANYLNAQYQKATTKSEVVRLGNEVIEKQQSIERTITEKNAFISNWENERLQEIVRLRAEHASVREELSKASKLYELSALVAPENGIVLALGPFSVGSVVTVGETVMTLVPLDSQIEAEIYIDPSEIGYVRVGDVCRIKLSTFPFQKHGTLDGVLRTVGNDSLSVEDSETPKYKARVQIKRAELKNVPSDFKLLPGMSLQCEIKIGTRRVITYFTYPLIRTFDESLREP